MSFILNAGEFDLGAGFIGRGTILAGEAYAVGTSTTGVQGLLNTSGLEGISATDTGAGGSYADIVFFRPSNDLLTGTITFTNGGGGSNGDSTLWSFLRDQSTTYLNNQSRFLIAPNVARSSGDPDDVIFSHLNSGLYVSASPHTNNQDFRTLFRPSVNWRFLARDHATALTEYPDTDEEGSVFAASCVNSATQWGLWIAGEVGDRSDYFNQTQGYFAIVLLVNGATTYFSAFSPSAANSTTRNDAPFRHFNIVPKAGQSTTDDNISELLILRDLGSFESAYIGKVPGFFYVDPNKAGFDNYTIGEQLDIDPVTNASFEGRDRALIVGRWGTDQALTASNTGALFTITSASPNRRTLENGRRIQLTTIAPTGMAINTNYWVINWNTTNFTFNLATIEGGSAITPTSDETGMAITAKAALLAMRCY